MEYLISPVTKPKPVVESITLTLTPAEFLYLAYLEYKHANGYVAGGPRVTLDEPLKKAVYEVFGESMGRLYDIAPEGNTANCVQAILTELERERT